MNVNLSGTSATARKGALHFEPHQPGATEGDGTVSAKRCAPMQGQPQQRKQIKVEVGTGFAAVSKHLAAFRTAFGGGSASPRVASHVGHGHSALPLAPEAKQFASQVKVRVGAGSIPAVQRHISQVPCRAEGALVAAGRHIVRPVFMGSGSLPAALKHLAKHR
jgi:hypothetical protein